MITDERANPVARQDYTPLGQPLTPPADDDRLWTGRRTEHDTGLIDLDARHYDPELGQFTTPDSILPDPHDPESLNRYAYAGNNFPKYSDPSGHMKMSVDLKKDQDPSSFGYMYARALSAGCGPFQEICVRYAPGLVSNDFYGRWEYKRGDTVEKSTLAMRRDYTGGLADGEWLGSQGTEHAVGRSAPPRPAGARASQKGDFPVQSVTAQTTVAAETAEARPLFERLGDAVQRTTDLMLDLVYPERHLLRGAAIESAGNGCVGLCFGALSIDVGVVATPVGPNDYFFGEIKGFLTLGGAFTGFTLGPATPPLDAIGGPMGELHPFPNLAPYPALGLSFGAGISLMGFSSDEVRTISDFSGWARNVGGSLGVVSREVD
jgi:RHS repeat-associated protein